MAYHVNPSTGNPGLCKAVKACPFGGANEHFSSQEEARAHFEKSMASAAWTPAKASPPPHAQNFEPHEFEAIQKSAEQLVTLLSKDGAFELPDEQETWWEVDDEGEDVIMYGEVQLDDFKLLASGLEISAYLHEPSGLVYKIPHFQSVGDLWSEDASWLVNSNAESGKESFYNLDHAKLAEAGLSYVPCHFTTVATTVGPLPVEVQRYLDPATYEKGKLTGQVQNRYTQDYGLSDLSMGNVRKHRATGAIVFIDCLFLP